MRFSYRTRRRFRRFAVGVLIFLLLFVLLYGLWVLWGQRFVVYSRDGARMDFSLSPLEPGQAVSRDEPLPTVEVVQNMPAEDTAAPGILTQVAGYYVDTGMLTDSIDAVRKAIEQLPAGSSILLDVKSKFGFFYYTTHVNHGSTSTAVDVAAMDQLISDLSHRDLYLIARVPAFRDRSFGLEQQSAGLALESGVLWSDPDACYWLDPANADTRAYLLDIAGELRLLGFDEVVFTDFCFPEAPEIVYDTSVDRATLLTETAAYLAERVAKGNFALSFQADGTGFSMPQGRSRLYLTDVEADHAQAVADAAGLSDPAVHLVFLTQSNDTRYNTFGVLRPLPLNPTA